MGTAASARPIREHSSLGSADPQVGFAEVGSSYSFIIASISA